MLRATHTVTVCKEYTGIRSPLFLLSAKAGRSGAACGDERAAGKYGRGYDTGCWTAALSCCSCSNRFACSNWINSDGVAIATGSPSLV